MHRYLFKICPDGTFTLARAHRTSPTLYLFGFEWQARAPGRAHPRALESMYRSSRTVLLGRLRYASAPRTTTRSLCAAASAASISAAAAIAARLHVGTLSDFRFSFRFRLGPHALGAHSKRSRDCCSLTCVL